MTPTQQIVEEMIHKIIQDEVAGEVWYESRQNEERLKKLLQNAEKSLSTTFSSLIEAAKREEREELLRIEEDWKDSYQGKLWSSAVQIAFSAPFPEVAVQHLLFRIAELHAKDKAVVNEVV